MEATAVSAVRTKNGCPKWRWLRDGLDGLEELTAERPRRRFMIRMRESCGARRQAAGVALGPPVERAARRCCQAAPTILIILFHCHFSRA